ncbi:glycosyltransferase [Undibacterium sp. Di26W]|uniref:glycosyltransferase n=1 Tax=Undibacterium sp. Di26W TaxID=3413035 RepID=UPI003BF1F6DA
METELPSRYCISTITCDNFCIGTEVLLYSVLKYNPWFCGDINIVINELSVANRNRLQAIYPVKFIHASADLVKKVDTLRSHFSYLHDIHLRFYSLVSFNLPQYDKVVYLDSDMYCAGDIKVLFLSTAPLQACLDGFSYEDRIAPLVAQAGLTLPTSQKRYGKHFENSFNAGVISISPQKLGNFNFQELLNMLDHDAWLSYGESIFTDQMVINRYFEGAISSISSQYNYMIFLGDYLNFVDGIHWQQAKIIHFSGKIKPWNDYDQQALWKSAPHYLPFIHQWRELLHEARSINRAYDQAQRVLNQYQWITSGADHQLQALDRLY